MGKRQAKFGVARSEDTAEFYDSLVKGDVSRGMWGKDRRFDADKIASSVSVQKFFKEPLRAYIGSRDRILDVGCGPGGFLAVLAELAGEVVGIDIAAEFVAAGNETIARHAIHNARVIQASSEDLPWPDACVDAVVLVDVLHHMERTEPSIAEAHRVLKPDGRLIIFEPNKLNPLLYAMCVLDRNEWGLLRLGSIKKYRELIGPSRFDIEHTAYNGLLIGPDGPLFMRIAEWLTTGVTSRILGWLSPKLILVARKRGTIATGATGATDCG